MAAMCLRAMVDRQQAEAGETKLKLVGGAKTASLVSSIGSSVRD
jgi:hypothetical protein